MIRQLITSTGVAILDAAHRRARGKRGTLEIPISRYAELCRKAACSEVDLRAAEARGLREGGAEVAGELRKLADVVDDIGATAALACDERQATEVSGRLRRVADLLQPRSAPRWIGVADLDVEEADAPVRTQCEVCMRFLPGHRRDVGGVWTCNGCEGREV